MAFEHLVLAAAKTVVLALGLTMGQWLSLPMIVAGIALFAWSARRA